MVKSSLSARLVMGAVAGFVATLPMTVAMRTVHRRLPRPERYPGTPREIVDSTTDAVGLDLPEDDARATTLLAHHAYGAACGAVIAAIAPKPSLAAGAGAGAAIWTLSYLGWIPAFGVLKPATQHPARRNAMMIGAHLVWGAALALALKEIAAETETVFASGPDRDRP